MILHHQDIVKMIIRPSEDYNTVYSRVRGWAHREHPAFIGSGMWNKSKFMAWMNGEYRWPERKNKPVSGTGNLVSIKKRKVENFF